MEKTAELYKTANEHLREGDLAGFKVAYDKATPSYIKTKIREGCLCERIFDPMTVSLDTPGVQIDDNDTDTIYYMEPVEQGAIAMEVSIRDTTEAVFVTSKRYKITVGKIETEEIKKPALELEASGNLLDMIKVNGIEALSDIQDVDFMRKIRCAVEANNVGLGLEARVLNVDWTNGLDKKPFAAAMNVIQRMKLKPHKWITSTVFDTSLALFENEQVGPLTADLISDGYEKESILKLPRVTTYKTDLEDERYVYDATNSYALNTKRFFDRVDSDGAIYTSIYLMVEQDFLGKIIRWRQDTLWSEWVKHTFHWQAWRYFGFDLGDMRGLVRVDIKLEDGSS